MDGSDPEFVEALRLTLKFFPEASRYLSLETGLQWDLFSCAMGDAEYWHDSSCEENPYSPEDRCGDFIKTGGFYDDNEVVYERLLKHVDFHPEGRAVVIPDALGTRGSSMDDCRPFVCHSRTVSSRLQEHPPIFSWGNDVIFVFESGEAILVDHDNRVTWAKSRVRYWKPA